MQISVAAFLRYITPLRGFYSVQPSAFPLFEGITSPLRFRSSPFEGGEGGMFLWVRDTVFFVIQSEAKNLSFSGAGFLTAFGMTKGDICFDSRHLRNLRSDTVYPA